MRNLFRLLNDLGDQFRWGYCEVLLDHMLYLLLTTIVPNFLNFFGIDLLLLLLLQAKQMLRHVCLLLHHLHRLYLHLLHGT
jgi:hypothetical protein